MINGWTLLDECGRGGSSVVWKVSDSNRRIGAMKFAQRRYFLDSSKYRRFKGEIEVVNKCADLDGVLPIWASSVPENARKLGDVWFVTPFATPLSAWDVGDALEEAVLLCRSLAETLAKIHERGFAHRDIKPSNIFLWNERWTLGDFGIAERPNSQETREGEKLGPVHYIAPEMLNDSVEAEGAAADVYSLAKLLWKLASGQNYPLPGVQYRGEPTAISNSVRHRGSHSLDVLIEAATQNDPKSRPTMAYFAQALSQWNAQPPLPQGPLDLTPFSKRSTDLIASHVSERETRTRIQNQANEAVGRYFLTFAEPMSDIQEALKSAQIGEVSVNSPAMGNAHFCADRIEERKTFWESSVVVILRDDRRRVSLRLGVNLGLNNVQDATDPLPDVYSPVLSAAGYLVEVGVSDGTHWTTTSELLWREAAEFLLGAPDDAAAAAMMVHGLRAQLQSGVKIFLDRFEAALSGRPHSRSRDYGERRRKSVDKSLHANSSQISDLERFVRAHFRLPDNIENIAVPVGQIEEIRGLNVIAAEVRNLVPPVEDVPKGEKVRLTIFVLTRLDVTARIVGPRIAIPTPPDGLGVGEARNRYSQRWSNQTPPEQHAATLEPRVLEVVALVEAMAVRTQDEYGNFEFLSLSVPSSRVFSSSRRRDADEWVRELKKRRSFE